MEISTQEKATEIKEKAKVKTIESMEEVGAQVEATVKEEQLEDASSAVGAAPAGFFSRPSRAPAFTTQSIHPPSYHGLSLEGPLH